VEKDLQMWMKENCHEVTSERSKANLFNTTKRWRSQPSEATATYSKAAARSRTNKTGLMNFALRNKGVWSVKKEKAV
jgi:hypothetical protein